MNAIPFISLALEQLTDSVYLRRGQLSALRLSVFSLHRL